MNKKIYNNLKILTKKEYEKLSRLIRKYKLEGTTIIKTSKGLVKVEL